MVLCCSKKKFLNDLLSQRFVCHRCSDTSNPVACTKGNYPAADRVSCIHCPKGTYCPDSATETPMNCPNGTYQDSTGKENCTLCPAGKRCARRDVTPVDCNNGTYSPLGTDNCLSCPPGYRLVLTRLHISISLFVITDGLCKMLTVIFCCFSPLLFC